MKNIKLTRAFEIIQKLNGGANTFTNTKRFFYTKKNGKETLRLSASEVTLEDMIMLNENNCTVEVSASLLQKGLVFVNL